MQKVLLFDLGGVLINWTGPQEFRKYLGPNCTALEARQRLASSPSVKALEIGELTPLAFADGFLEEFDLPFKAAEFVDVFASWAGVPFPGVTKELARLRSCYRLACLSNTNDLHWRYLMDIVGVRDWFDDHFASHILKLSKPSPAIYERVIQDLGVKPSEILFFDDMPENIAAAKALGMEISAVDPAKGGLPNIKKLRERGQA
ncbi:MAG: HAD family phosphatase [Sneathiellales bacterium]|nr:HAD family phosphatase [Sneathiellales bacterium]